MASVYNLKCEDTTYTILGKAYPGKKWSWTFEKVDPRYLYSTNDMGEGIFEYDSKKGERTQLAGTCQFSACKTASGMRRKIGKLFDWMKNGSTEAE